MKTAKVTGTGLNKQNAPVALVRTNNLEVTVYKPAVTITNESANIIDQNSQRIDDMINWVRYGNLQMNENLVPACTVVNGSSCKCSSSSDELMDTSDETVNDINVTSMNNSGQEVKDKQQPLTAEEQADKIVHDAEMARARMFEVPGKIGTTENLNMCQIDEDYQMIDSHVDEVLKRKIQAMEYVELGKLIPKNRFLHNDNSQHQRLEIVNKNGMSFLAPASDNSIVINSYG